MTEANEKEIQLLKNLILMDDKEKALQHINEHKYSYGKADIRTIDSEILKQNKQNMEKNKKEIHKYSYNFALFSCGLDTQTISKFFGFDTEKGKYYFYGTHNNDVYSVLPVSENRTRNQSNIRKTIMFENPKGNVSFFFRTPFVEKAPCFVFDTIFDQLLAYQNACYQINTIGRTCAFNKAIDNETIEYLKRMPHIVRYFDKKNEWSTLRAYEMKLLSLAGIIPQTTLIEMSTFPDYIDKILFQKNIKLYA